MREDEGVGGTGKFGQWHGPESQARCGGVAVVSSRGYVMAVPSSQRLWLAARRPDLRPSCLEILAPMGMVRWQGCVHSLGQSFTQA
eukprot:251469-Pelagomonas_calceolata.AAC.2